MITGTFCENVEINQHITLIYVGDFHQAQLLMTYMPGVTFSADGQSYELSWIHPANHLPNTYQIYATPGFTYKHVADSVLLLDVIQPTYLDVIEDEPLTKLVSGSIGFTQSIGLNHTTVLSVVSMLTPTQNVNGEYVVNATSLLLEDDFVIFLEDAFNLLTEE